ncbi:MAG: hypothetical protein Q9187_007789 [Circinaria calcarea]
MRCLASAIPLLPRLSRVIITARNRPNYSFLWPRDPDLRVGCFDIVPPTVKHGFTNSEAARTHDTTWRQGVLDLLQTLSEGRLTSRILSLAIGTHHDFHRPSLPIEDFDLEATTRSIGCSHTFYHLEKAYLTVDVRNSLKFPKSLGHLQGLKLLHLSFECGLRNHNTGVFLDRMFDGIPLQSLEDFSIRSLTVAESGLVDFLDTHSRIRRLSFVNVRIVGGTWFSFLEQLKNMDINLDVCKIDVMGTNMFEEKQSNTPVIAFLDGRGPNPFEDALTPLRLGF